MVFRLITIFIGRQKRYLLKCKYLTESERKHSALTNQQVLPLLLINRQPINELEHANVINTARNYKGRETPSSENKSVGQMNSWRNCGI